MGDRHDYVALEWVKGEIAETLSLSYRTVTSHVRNILGKLDVASRTAAATQAVRRGLI